MIQVSECGRVWNRLQFIPNGTNTFYIHMDPFKYIHISLFSASLATKAVLRDCWCGRTESCWFHYNGSVLRRTKIPQHRSDTCIWVRKTFDINRYFHVRMLFSEKLANIKTVFKGSTNIPREKHCHSRTDRLNPRDKIGSHENIQLVSSNWHK